MSQNKRINLYVTREESNAESVLNSIIDRWEDKYGGVTTLSGAGHWAGMSEDVTLVQTICNENELDRDDLRDVQEYIIRKMGESAVLATIDTVESIMLSESDVTTPQRIRAD